MLLPRSGLFPQLWSWIRMNLNSDHWSFRSEERVVDSSAFAHSIMNALAIAIASPTSLWGQAQVWGQLQLDTTYYFLWKVGSWVLPWAPLGTAVGHLHLMEALTGTGPAWFICKMVSDDIQHSRGGGPKSQPSTRGSFQCERLDSDEFRMAGSNVLFFCTLTVTLSLSIIAAPDLTMPALPVLKNLMSCGCLSLWARQWRFPLQTYCSIELCPQSFAFVWPPPFAVFSPLFHLF